MDRLATSRLEEMQARDHAEAEVERLRNDLSVREEDLSADNLDDTLARLRREHAGDADALARIDDLERHRRALTDARRELVRDSEEMGNVVADETIRSMRPNARILYGDPHGRGGRPGEFDFIYIERDADGRIATIIVVEAKGASSGLGTREVNGLDREQGSPAYLSAIAETMRTRDGSDLDMALAQIAHRRPPGAEVRYILVEARVDSGGNPVAPRVSEFDLSAPSP